MKRNHGSKVGVGTIKNVEAKATKHAGSKTHIKNSEMFHMLGPVSYTHLDVYKRQVLNFKK